MCEEPVLNGSACRFGGMPSSHRRILRSGIFTALLGLVALLPTAAEADNSYLDADPQPRSEAALEPSRVTVAFHDTIARSGATIVVRDGSGSDVSNGAYQIEGNNIYVNLEYPFPRGTYTVYYRVTDADGTPFGGQYQFSYGPGSFAAGSTKTWRGQSNIPKVVALPTDVRTPAGGSSDSPTTPPGETGSPTSTDDPDSSTRATEDASPTGSSVANSTRTAWAAGTLAAIAAAVGIVVLVRRRRA
jgi:methionine-rich copper-binding protein CopC